MSDIKLEGGQLYYCQWGTSKRVIVTFIERRSIAMALVNYNGKRYVVFIGQLSEIKS